MIKITGELLSTLNLEDTTNYHPVVSVVIRIGTAYDTLGENPLALIIANKD